MASELSSALRNRLLSLQLKREAAVLRHEAARLDATDVDALVARAARPMIFAVSAGRSGTAALAEVLAGIEAIHAVHEGKPAFHAIMREALGHPALARAFLLVRKLPYIAAQSEPVYCETSHVFGKGFLEPMLAMGLRPSIVFLHRAARPVARSFHRIGAIPLRTRNGRQHLLSPADPSLLPAFDWQDFTDYQLCYWYALETRRRQQVLSDVAGRAGCACHWMRIEDLATVADVRALLSALRIEVALTGEDEARLADRLGRRYNLKEKHTAPDLQDADLSEQERTVIQRIQGAMPELDVARLVGPLDAGPLGGFAGTPAITHLFTDALPHPRTARSC